MHLRHAVGFRSKIERKKARHIYANPANTGASRHSQTPCAFVVGALLPLVNTRARSAMGSPPAARIRLAASAISHGEIRLRIDGEQRHFIAREKYKKSPKSLDPSQFCENPRKQTSTSAKRDVLSIAYDHEMRALNASKSEALNYPLKEVIHPHVPVGIPCYDFTPVAVRSVGGCLACALARRLRVQTTPMV